MQQTIERGTGRRSVECKQTTQILDHMRQNGGDWSIGELARALELEKNAVSARVNELLYETFQVVSAPKRRDRISGILVRPVALVKPNGGKDANS